MSVRRPMSAKAAPRLTVVVVLPTPPFWLAKAMIRGNVWLGVRSIFVAVRGAGAVSGADQVHEGAESGRRG